MLPWADPREWGVAARAVEASRLCSRSSFGITTPCVAKSRLMDKVCPTCCFLFGPSTTCVADIREFNPSSWRSIIGIVPQVRFSYFIAIRFTFVLGPGLVYGDDRV